MAAYMSAFPPSQIAQRMADSKSLLSRKAIMASGTEYCETELLAMRDVFKLIGAGHRHD